MNKEQNSSEIFTCVRYPVGCPDGKIQLPHLVEKGMDIAAWEFRRAEIRRRLHAVMGLAPPVTILRWRVLDQTIQENVLCKRIAYSSCDGETATGYLLTGTCLREQRRPAILALHPTDLECADSLVARRGECEEDYPYALELARRGFVVFAPDLFMRWHYPNAAATEQLYDTEVLSQKHPLWSAMGRAVYDHQQALRLLCSLDGVDAARIGVIGHSLGGTNAMLLAALDNRIKAVVLSCCVCSFCGHPYPDIWCREKGFCYFPSLRNTLKEGVVPFEWMEVLACIAPRPLHIFAAQKDVWFPRWDGALESVRRAEEVYRIYHQSEALDFVLWDGPHSFPSFARKEAFSFLENNLL